VKETLLNPAVWITALMYFGVKFIRYTFLFWLPLYLTQAFGYSNEVAGYTSSVFEAAGFAGVLLSGYISDKLYHSRRFPVGALFMFGLAIVFILHPFLARIGYWGNVSAVALVGLFTYGPDALMSGAAAQDLGKENAGTTAGFINGVGSVGQIASPYAVAFVSEKFGWHVLFEVFVAVSILSALLLCTHWNYGRKTVSTPNVLKVEPVNV
jgi:sugar phosphate permease